METNTETESLTVRVSKEIKEALEKMAKSQDLTVSQLCRRHFAVVLGVPAHPAIEAVKAAGLAHPEPKEGGAR